MSTHHISELLNVVIIGSGPAAWTAAIYSARAGLSPLVFEGAFTAENQAALRLPMGQLATTTEIENYPGFPAGDVSGFLDSALSDDRAAYLLPNDGKAITGPELVELMRRQAVNFGTQIVAADIASVDFSARPLCLTDSENRKYETKSVIVATGASANYLGLESENRFKNRGVSACAVCDGALPRFRNGSLAVIGGGDSAIEEATYLTRFAKKVYLVHRRDELRASKTMQQRAMTHPKIEILWNRTLTEVLGNDESGVTAILLTGTKGGTPITVDVSGVFLAIGHTPNTGFLGGQLELLESGYIKRIIPFRSLTSAEGVFVAGDVTDERYKQAITAAAGGCMAALDAEHYLETL